MHFLHLSRIYLMKHYITDYVNIYCSIYLIFLKVYSNVAKMHRELMGHKSLAFTDYNMRKCYQ